MTKFTKPLVAAAAFALLAIAVVPFFADAPKLRGFGAVPGGGFVPPTKTGGGGAGDITEVTTAAASGLTGGAASGAVALTLKTTCSSSDVLYWDGDSWECTGRTSTWEFRHECLTAITSGNQGPMIANISGTGANNTSTGEPGRPGICNMQTGTTTTGRASYIMGGNQSAVIRFGGGALTGEIAVRMPTSICDGATDTCAVRCGFIDATTAAPTDGAYLEFAPATSANWRVVTANNATRTNQDSSPAVAVAADTWYKLAATVASDASSVSYAINGASAGSIATNIPTAAARETGFGCSIIKSAGTNNRQLDVDYLYATQVFTSTR